MDSTFKDAWLDEDLRKVLEGYHKQFRSGDVVEAEVLREYEKLIEGVLEKLVG